SRRRHTRSKRDWSSDVCSSDLTSRGITTTTNHRGIGSTLIHHFRHRRPGRLGMVRAKACLNNPRVITSHRLTHPTVMLQTRDKIPAECTPHMIHVMRYGKCRISMVIPALRPNLAVGGPLAQLFLAPESLAPRSC